jgi:uncharacterized protein YndB with AHSA1/START domain
VIKTAGKLEISTPSDREIVMTRSFNAPRAMVFEAWTKPELIKRWLGAFAGWSFDVCEVDLRIGGAYRYVWKNGDTKMGMGGVYREIVVPERIVCTEKFDDPWYDGEAVGTMELFEEGGRTTLVQTMNYGSKQVRDAVLQSPMESGVTASYDALERLLAS